LRAGAALLAAAGLLLTGASFTAHREVAAGNQALQAGDPAGAASHYQAALADHPDDPAVRYDLGTARLAAGDLDRAVDDLGHAAAQAEGPLKAQADYNLGNALMARGEKQGPAGKADLEGAVNAYRRSLAADPEDADARRNLQLAASRLAALAKTPPPSGQQGGRKPSGQQGGSPQSGQQGDSRQSGQQGGKQPSGRQAGSQGAQSPGDAQGKKPGPEKGPEKGSQAGEHGEKKGDRQAAGAEGDRQKPGAQAGTEGRDGEAGADEAGNAGDANAQADAGKPLPDDVAQVLSGLRRQEAQTLREALRRSLGPPQPEDKDW